MPFQAGAARTAITPPLGVELQGHFEPRVADAVHDPLFAKALVFNDGERRIAIVIADLIALLGEQVEPAKALIAERCGIPPERVLIAGTHTHSGPVTMDVLNSAKPAAYLATLPGLLADSVERACAALQPAVVGFATGACPTEVHNRRWHMRDGSVRMNPGVRNPDALHAAGPTDPTLAVTAVQTPEGEPIAVLANLSLHYVGGWQNEISADYFGYFDRALQRCAGREFVAMMSNGCQGDINNIDVSRPKQPAPPYRHTERVANLCAGEAYRAWNTLWPEGFRDDLTVDGALEVRTMTPRRPTPEQVADAKAYLNDHAPGDNLLAYSYAKEHALMSTDWPETRAFPVQALRLGDVGLVGLPAEPFVELGLEIRRRSPFGLTIPIGLANDCAGYVAPDRQIDLGGYETTLCRHVYAPKGTAQDWVETSLRLLAQLAGNI